MVVTSVDANITQKDNNRHDGTDTELKDFVVSRYNLITADYVGAVAKRWRRRSRKPKIVGSNPSRAYRPIFFFILIF